MHCLVTSALSKTCSPPVAARIAGPFDQTSTIAASMRHQRAGMPHNLIVWPHEFNVMPGIAHGGYELSIKPAFHAQIGGVGTPRSPEQPARTTYGLLQTLPMYNVT